MFNPHYYKGGDQKLSKLEEDYRHFVAKKNSKADDKVSNAVFAATDEYFKKCCETANVKPTSRQASKWRRHTGKAYQEGRPVG
jgi:hypothetical protein